MAVVTITPVESPRDGAGAVAVTRTSPMSVSDSYRFLNDGKIVLLFEKTGAGACTVTVTTPATLGGIAVADPTYTVPASTGDVVIGPFNPAYFNDENGYVSFTVSEITGLSCGVMRV